jgi:hypothetical protein
VDLLQLLILGVIALMVIVAGTIFLANRRALRAESKPELPAQPSTEPEPLSVQPG